MNKNLTNWQLVELWKNLHFCYLNGKVGVWTNVLGDPEIADQIAKFADIGEDDNKQTPVKLKDREKLKTELVRNANYLAQAQKKAECTLAQTKAIVGFLEALLEKGQLPFSRCPKSKWYREQVHDRLISEGYASCEWVGRGKQIKLLDALKLEKLLARWRKNLEREVSLQRIIEEAALQRKEAKDGVLDAIMVDLEALRHVDNDMALRLNSNINKLLNASHHFKKTDN